MCARQELIFGEEVCVSCINGGCIGNWFQSVLTSQFTCFVASCEGGLCASNANIALVSWF